MMAFTLAATRFEPVVAMRMRGVNSMTRPVHIRKTVGSCVGAVFSVVRHRTAGRSVVAGESFETSPTGIGTGDGKFQGLAVGA